jgi:LCP family protein required for cell wall assembly
VPQEPPSQPANSRSGGDGTPPRKPPRSIYDTRRSKKRRPRWARVVLWTLGSLVATVLVAALVVGWWVHGLVDAVGNISHDVKDSQRYLHNLPTNSEPTIALVVGSDHRSGDGKGAPSRSDTLMLVRVDPRTKYISLLSLPRDLHVDIPGFGTDKINAAYSDGGYKLALKTVEDYTGLDVNYLITVDFSGFTKLVGAFGGVYVPVDQYYYHKNQAGYDQYSQIDIPPGYQKLNGLNSLAFSRYRHTDSDFYRNARQQVFLKAFQQRASSQLHGIGISQLGTYKSVAEAIASSVQVTGPDGPPSISTMIKYATTAYEIRGRAISVRLDAQTAGDATNSYVVATDDAKRQAVFAFMHPESVVNPKNQLPGKDANGNKPPKAFKPQVDPSGVAMTVVNGNGVDGSANKAATALMTWGYPATVSNTPAPSFSFQQNAVYYRAKDKAAAEDVAAILGATQTHPITPTYAAYAGGGLVVVIGKRFTGTLAKQPPSTAATGGLPDDITRDPAIYHDVFLTAGHTNFRMLYPTVRQDGSSLQTMYGTPLSGTSVRIYNIKDAGGGNNSAYSYWSYNGTPGAYWGIEQTRFVNAPILANPDQLRKLDGRTYQFYFNGSHIHMVAFIWHGVAYWVQNTLRDDMSNEDMIAIARSLKPVK